MPPSVQVALGELVNAAKDGLLALSVGVGLGVLQELMDLSPRGIRTHLGLNKPIYTKTSSYGHFGREPEASGAFSWERTDLADELRRAF